MQRDWPRLKNFLTKLIITCPRLKAIKVRIVDEAGFINFLYALQESRTSLETFDITGIFRDES